MRSRASRPRTAAELLLPSTLREFQVDLAGRLVMLDEPGAEVKALRERYGFTQDFLAPLVGLRRESLSRIESGAVGLSLEFVRRFTRVMTLARGVREHLAWVEARGNAPDERHLDMLSMTLRIEPEAKEEIVFASMVSYERKRREALRPVDKGISNAARYVPGVRRS
jgi:DNA-binding XRE family transcriptional regulator